MNGGMYGVHQQSDVVLMSADHSGVDPRRVVVPTMEASVQSHLRTCINTYIHTYICKYIRIVPTYK